MHVKLSLENLKSDSCPLHPTRIYCCGMIIILRVWGCLFILLIKGNCKISHVYVFFLIRFSIILIFLMAILRKIPKAATRNNKYLAMTTLPI